MLTFLSPLFSPLFGLRAAARGSTALVEGAKSPVMVFDVECFGPDGKLKWRERAHNLVTNAGRTDILNKYFKGSTYTAAWYLFLKGTGAVAATDTLASSGAWSEVTPYAGSRPAITWGSPSGTSTVSLASSAAISIAITGTATVAGAGCCTVASGTSGTIYNVSDFAASRNVLNGDTLNVTPTITQS